MPFATTVASRAQRAACGALLLSTSLFALMPGTAFAQTAPAAAPAQAADESNNGLGDIIVQARKIDENLQKVPVAVTVLSGADLTAHNVQKLQDVAAFTPGMSMRQGQSSPAALTIQLRGQVQTDILATLDPSVGTYVDGVYWARAYGLNGDFLDAQSVQVLKGPQGTLFGRNTTGGALVITSNNPNFNGLSGNASVTYGRFNEFNLTGVLNAPLIADTVALRIAATRTTRTGYTLNLTTGQKLDNRNRWSGRAKLLIKPTDDLSILFSGEYFNMDEAGPSKQLLLAPAAFNAATGPFTGGVPAATAYPFTDPSTGYVYTAANTTYNVAGTFGAVYGAAFGLPAQIAQLGANPDIAMNDLTPYVQAKTLTLGTTVKFDQSWGAISAIGGYRRVQSLAGFDLDGSSAPGHFTEGKQDLKQWSFEVQAVGTAFHDTLDFAAGAFLFHEKGFDQSLSITLPALNPITSHFFAMIDNDSSGVYGQVTYHLTDRLRATGGVRYSIDTKGIDSRNNNYNRTTGISACSLVTATVASAEVDLPGCSIARSDTFRGWSYTAGLDYSLTDDILVYIKTAKGFRSGGQNLRAPSPTFFIPFQPETAYSYEAGFKAEFFDRHVRLNVAGYLSHINNIQRSTLIAAPGGGVTATVLGNAGKARFNGLEAELQVLVTKGLRLSGTLGLTSPKYLSYRDLSGDRSFERFNGIPKSSYTLAADYDTKMGGISLKLHGDYAWQASQAAYEYNYAPNPSNAAILDALTIKSAGIVGARATIGFDDDRYQLSLFGRNLTNNRAISQSLLVAPLGYISGTRREPVTYGATLAVKF
jgi:iron complex outermembrane receptor protein